MNIFDEIKALWQLRSVAQEITQEAKQMNGTDAGWRTSEFWTKILTVDLPVILGAVKGIVSPQIAAYILLGSQIAYQLFRTWLKRDAVIANVKKLLADVKSGQTETIAAVVDKITTQPNTAATPQ